MSNEISQDDVKNVQPIGVDPIYAASIAIQSNGNDFTLIFQRLRPATAEVKGIPQHIAISEAVAAITVSPQTLRDFKEIIDDSVRKFEDDFGEIKTVFTRSKTERK